MSLSPQLAVRFLAKGMGTITPGTHGPWAQVRFLARAWAVMSPMGTLTLGKIQTILLSLPLSLSLSLPLRPLGLKGLRVMVVRGEGGVLTFKDGRCPKVDGLEGLVVEGEDPGEVRRTITVRAKGCIHLLIIQHETCMPVHTQSVYYSSTAGKRNRGPAWVERETHHTHRRR
jgi:hypothetical protein